MLECLRAGALKLMISTAAPLLYLSREEDFCTRGRPLWFFPCHQSLPGPTRRSQGQGEGITQEKKLVFRFEVEVVNRFDEPGRARRQHSCSGSNGGTPIQGRRRHAQPCRQREAPSRRDSGTHGRCATQRGILRLRASRYDARPGEGALDRRVRAQGGRGQGSEE